MKPGAGWIRGRSVVWRLARRYLRPSLEELHRSAASVHLNPTSMLSALTGTPLDTATGEIQQAEDTLRVSTLLPPSSFPAHTREWALSDSATTLLYALVRTTRPLKMVETGIGNGQSSRAVLAAMDKNGVGTLYSTDVRPELGRVRPPAPPRWVPKISTVSDATPALRTLLGELGEIDIFLHDSNHTYPNQRFEYGAAWTRLALGGWLLSDDVDGTYAFLDFCRERDVMPHLLISEQKVFGAVEKGRR